MKDYKSKVDYHQMEVDQEKFLGLSPVIENAPYLLAKDYKQRLAGSSTGASSSSSHSSNSSSSSASGGSYVGSSTGASSSSSHSSNSSSSSASGATVPLENRV